MPTFEEIKDHNPRLIRKGLEGSVFVKPYDDADVEIEKIWTAAGLVIPAGYKDVGLITKGDGVTFGAETDTADTESWGYAEPTRRDITKKTSTLAFVAQESKRLTKELVDSVDYSGVTPDADGNIVMDTPARPQARRWRAFVISKDGDGADAIYMVKAYPNCQVTEVSEQKWSEEDEVQYSTTMTAFYDAAWGTSVREIWGGPGVDAAELGFTV